MRVLVIEKRALSLAALSALLERTAGVSGIAVVEGIEEALTERGLLPTSSDACVLSGDGLGVEGLREALRQLARAAPGLRVVVLDSRPDERRAVRAFAEGASAYLSVRCDSGELATAIRGGPAGERFLGSCLSARAVSRLEADSTSERHPIETLSARQRQVLRMIAEGKRTIEIARELGISTKTVESHRTQISRRLGATKVADLVRVAIREGMVEAV